MPVRTRCLCPSRAYADVVNPLVAAGRVWIHSIVLLELYAVATNRTAARAIDAIPAAAQSLDRLYHPGADDLVIAGRDPQGRGIS